MSKQLLIHPKSTIQEEQYDFPYHYLPHRTQGGYVRISRSLSWGFSYWAWLEAAVTAITNISPNSVLDVGCGDGRLLSLLENRIPVLKGIDLSDRAIAFAKAFHPNLDFQAMDVSCESGTWDCVTLIEVLEHIPDDQLEIFLATVDEKVKVNGHLILAVPSICIPLNPKHFRHYSLDMLVSHIGKQYEIVSVDYLCKVSILANILNRVVINRFWILNQKNLLKWAWNIYVRYCFRGNPNNASHLIVVAKKLE